MKWKGRRQSDNVNNSGRGSGGSGGIAIGGGGLILALIIFVLTGDPIAALQTGLGNTNSQNQVQEEYVMSDKEKELYEYSSVVLADTEDTWTKILAKEGIKYEPAEMNVFKDSIKSGCGIASSGSGPFYCSVDKSVYIDLSFYDTLIKKYGAKEGDFVLSYVISHEIGHHIQTLTGVMDKYQQMMQKLSKTEQNALTVRLELQADYLAGVVAKYQSDQGYLDDGDIEEAISTAWAIGDDTLQENSQGHANPESFTHGTSEQRARWYKKGYETGDLSGWDTFSLDAKDL